MSGGAEISVRSAEPDFRVDTLSGDTVSLDGLSSDRALVGFFLAGCTPCNRQLPTFVELAKTILGGPSQVVAVLSGMPDKTAEYAARLVGVASVVLEVREPTRARCHARSSPRREAEAVTTH